MAKNAEKGSTRFPQGAAAVRLRGRAAASTKRRRASNQTSNKHSRQNNRAKGGKSKSKQRSDGSRAPAAGDDTATVATPAPASRSAATDGGDAVCMLILLRIA